MEIPLTPPVEKLFGNLNKGAEIDEHKCLEVFFRELFLNITDRMIHSTPTFLFTGKRPFLVRLRF